MANIRKKGERGMAIIFVFVLISLLTSATLAIGSFMAVRSKTSGTYDDMITSSYNADAALQIAEYYIKNSIYDQNGNVWFNTHTSTGGFKAIYVASNGIFVNSGVMWSSVSNVNLGSGVSVYVTLTDHGTGWSTMSSTATLSNGTSQGASMEAKGRDAFSKYMFFTDADSINIGTTTVRGDVHSNKNDNFYYGGAKMFGNVTAVGVPPPGIQYFSGATSKNTTFYKEVNGAVSRINIPSTNDIATLHNSASDVYQVDNSSGYYKGTGAVSAQIYFNKNQVTITALNISGQTVKTGTYALPPNGLIFVQGDVTSMSGQLSGQCTVANIGQVNVTDKLTYVDPNGNPAYQLCDRNGIPIGDTGNGVVWDDVNYKYLPNSNYNPPTPSVLGIMSSGNVVVDKNAPYNMQFMAAVFSSTGNWNCDLTNKKGNIRVLGSITEQKGGWRYNGYGYGYALSGTYTYDGNLLTYPPPFWLQANTPTFSSWRRN